jgi:hypothetical protein
MAHWAEAGFSGSPGPLPHAAQMKRSFGADLGPVQAYTGSAARAACEAMGAEAYTVGNRIAFRDESPPPKLVGHELAHTVQQGAVAQGPVMKKDPAAPASDLEAEADQAGEAAEKGAPAQVSGRVAQGAVQRFQIAADQQKAYPRAAAFVKNEMPRVANDARVARNLKTYGTNTGPTARDVAKDVAWGSGPTVKFKAMGANGQFSPGIGSTELRIKESIAKDYQNEKDAGRLPAHELFLESTILHEYTHYLDDQDGVDFTGGAAGEEGQEFEEATYGTDIDSVADAQDVLTPAYGAGDWTVRVEGKEAGYKQRVCVTGAKSGNGVYEGQVGTTASVKGAKVGKWKLRIEHDDGKGWKPSRMHNVKEGANNYLVRSEDWKDRDMNDLEVRVKK